MNSGSKWPMVGAPRALSTRGWTLDGPGPIRTRVGGVKEVTFMLAVVRVVLYRGEILGHAQ
jgi:hypothetical protein